MAGRGWKAPQNFVSMEGSLHCDDGDTEDSELWLLKVPKGFDVSALNNLRSSVLDLSGTMQTLKVKTEEGKKMHYSVAAFRDSDDCKAMSTVMTNTSGQTVFGRDVSHMLVVTEAPVPSALQMDNALLAPKAPVPMPTGLRPRFIPFGAGTPCPSISGKIKKKEKHASKGEESMEEDFPDSKKHNKKIKQEVSAEEVRQNSKKRKRDTEAEDSVEVHHSSKKRKRDTEAEDSIEVHHSSKKRKRDTKAGDSIEEEVLQHSEEIKREVSPDRSEGESPKKKKKKKSKHRHSEPREEELLTVEAGDSVDVTDSPASKKSEKKKRRKSEGAAEDSCGVGDSFVLDTTGDKSLVNGEQLATDNHAKSKQKKSKKKKRKTASLP